MPVDLMDRAPLKSHMCSGDLVVAYKSGMVRAKGCDFLGIN